MLFGDIDGNPPSPNAFSAAWSDFAKRIGLPDVTFHALRHTHASQLIDAGVDMARRSNLDCYDTSLVMERSNTLILMSRFSSF